MAQPASLYRDASGAGEVDSGCDVPAAQEAGGSEQAGGCAPPAEPPLPLDAELERQQQARADIEARTQEILSRGAAYLAGHSLSDFNAEAAAQQKARQHAAAAATYSALFVKAKRSNLTHPELYICHSNCSAAYLALGLHDEALHHAVRCQQLAMASLRRNFKGAPSYVKSFLRKGRALMGLGRNREAALALDEGLKYDPLNLDLKHALQQANAAVVKDLAEGKGRETKAIEYPEPRQRISFHPYAAPLHKIKTDDMLPLKLLTPFQGENDHHIKDTYNYVTVQTDIRMPGRHLRQLEDGYALPRFRAAIEAAVQAIVADDKDCRVLNLGAGAGLHSMLALRAGARHATVVERWLYLALASKECMLANEFTEEQFKVLYKRPTDLKLKEDLSVCCNLLIANILDEGLLTSGLIPCMRHALDAGLLTSDAVLLPLSATVYMQAVEIRTGEVCGLDMSAANLYRWHPAFAAGVPLAAERVVALSEPQEVWHFSLGAPPDKSDVKTVDVEFTRRGRFNAVMFWYKLHLFGDVYLSTGPEAVAEGLRSMQPAVRYTAGELSVAAGTVLPVVASHNTVRLRFDVESAEFLNLHKPDASFPHSHFAMLADEERCQAYKRAIERAVAKRRAADGGAHVLDIGCGSGVLSLLAARAGADSVVACDIHSSLCDVARKAAAANSLSKAVSVVHRDAGTLQRGREIRPLGVNVVIADVFDAGLIGDGFPYLLDLTRRKVVQPGATVIPAAATLYCMGVEALTGRVAGLDMTPMNTYRWDAGYQAISLGDLPHRRLTKPTRVMEIAFDGDNKSRGRESMLKLEVVEEGLLNAVVFWFDLHLDDCETLSNAPAGIGEGGVLLCELETGTNESSPEAPSTPASTVQDQQEAQVEDAAAASVAADGRNAVEAQAVGAAAADSSIISGSSDAAASAVADAPAAQLKEQHPQQEPQQAEQEQEEFVPADSFAGARPDYAFKLGEQGLGYYLDPYSSAGSASGTADGAALAAAEAALQREVEGQAAVTGSGALATLSPTEPEAPLPGPLPAGPRHHWGQALQYLDRAVPVAPGRRLALLARREEGKLRFALRQGVGEYVPRAPWKIEWGGGSSIENPHYQRVHYCQLLVSDFLQRVKSRRFPPIEKDMRMVLAHCGSLLLDPAALQEATHELVVLEALQLMNDFSPAASVDAITKRPLRLC
ncbi:arginine methyltransferase [Micractinium conductrix]|uniref:type I protein arginine methyltransferase n=1 Tax=Micractinium conductrix TaxID=554055 RepID=A0A2P6V5T2_9CHLO|nr:arginine methyltransferase [Micractinium conductrix]|eukprot:PSC69443.1 arginine methyltransferase [Micractinium conductrix]